MNEQDVEQQLLLPQQNNPDASILLRVASVKEAFVKLVFGIVFGTFYLHECPAQEKIPIALIVCVSLILLGCIINLPNDIRFIVDPSGAVQFSCSRCLQMLLHLAAFGLFIAECYWIYTIHPNTADRASPDYCDYLFYNIMYWGSTMGLIAYCISVLVSGPVLIGQLLKK